MMLRLRVIATGSRGNAYLLTAGGSSLLLDAGLPYKAIVRATDGLAGICGALVTHEHNDHAKAARDIERIGIPILCSAGTASAVGLSTRGCRALDTAHVGAFEVMPFVTEHDAAEPFGFMIRAKGQTLLYATDTYFVRYRFAGVNWWLVECNYCDELIAGMDNVSLRNRLLKSHMSLSRLVDLFKANDLTRTRGIMLCHMSDERSDESEMVETISNVTGKPVVAAEAGMEIELCK